MESVNAELKGRDIAIGAGNQPRSFADWFDGCAREGDFTDAQLAKAYAQLHHLKQSQHQNPPPKTPPQTRITKWRTGQGEPPTAAVAYRIGRSLQELGLPVSGLEALIAGHHLVELLGTVGSHISLCIARSKPMFHPMAPEIVHVLPMLDKLAPRISRELTVRKMQFGIRELDIDEFGALQTPLPEDLLYPKELTPQMDAGFLAWTYDQNEAFLKLLPSFAAAIALIKNPTPEVIELAAKHLEYPQGDIMSLLKLGTPRWVLRACGYDEEPHEPRAPEPEPDYTNLNNFFDAYEADFSLPGKFGCVQSPTYPDVHVRLCQSEYHGPGTAIDIDYLLVDGGNRSQKITAVLDYLKTLADKHNLKLIAWPADEDDIPVYRSSGFIPCNAWHSMGRRIEWPRCDHKKEAQSA
jgi:hypothetical protein